MESNITITAEKLYAIRGDITHVLVILICIIAFLKQVKVLEAPRFLVNIVYAWILMGVMYLEKIILFVIDIFIINTLYIQDEIKKYALNEALHTINHVDIILSFSSSYFLIKAGQLLRTYNNIGLPKRWSAKYLTILYSLIILTILSMEFESTLLILFISILDVFIAFYAAAALARRFYKPSVILRKDKYTIYEVLSRYSTMIMLYLWGGLQLPYTIFILKDYDFQSLSFVTQYFTPDFKMGYFTVLMFVKFIIAINIAIYCVKFIPDKERYKFKNEVTGETETSTL